MIVDRFSLQAPTRMLLSWAKLPSSVYYYKHKDGKPGLKPSFHTWMQDGSMVDNQVVIDQIKEILSQEFCCYGYENIAVELRKLDYWINKKKVYRLMDEHKLLLGKVIRTSGKRKFVQHRKIQSSYPMEFLCLDIKYVYVHGEKRNFYLLTIIDVFSRKIVDQIFQKSIKQMDVIDAFRRINNEYGIKGVTIRNDNGSQFIANSVKQYLRSAEANQEFTHIATPEENSYIEAFHSIIQREVIERYEFTGFYDAKQTLIAHTIWYNTRRFHKAIKMTPNEKWEQNIHLTNQKRVEQNLSKNLNNNNDEKKQDYQYLSQNLNTKTNNYYTTVSTNVSK